MATEIMNFKAYTLKVLDSVNQCVATAADSFALRYASAKFYGESNNCYPPGTTSNEDV